MKKLSDSRKKKDIKNRRKRIRSTQGVKRGHEEFQRESVKGKIILNNFKKFPEFVDNFPG